MDCPIYYFCIVFISIFNSIWADEYKGPIIVTKYGPVKGTIQYSRHGREYKSFRGIPYAKPPTGELRFKAPQDPDSWTLVKANKDKPFCIQKNYFFANPKVEGEEDCLYLNVYVPQKTTRLLPVMVFIYGGGFFSGAASSKLYGPEYLMDKDVILVTFNYRLGVMGFLTTLDDQAPGNFGLKDQVHALRFVRDNIANFGGDKNRVTLFGQSAGSASVNLHMMSPSSKGLFHQVINHSGVGLNWWANTIRFFHLEVTKNQARFVGCGQHIGNNTNLVKCLRGVNAKELLESGDKFKYFSIEPLTPYAPVPELKTPENPEPFLTKYPIEYLQAGELQKVPWIIGVTQDEGIIRAAPLLRQSKTYEELNSQFDALLPKALLLELSAGGGAPKLFNNMIDFYMGGNHSVNRNDPKSIQGFIDLYSDRCFVADIHKTFLSQRLKGHKPIWVYNFGYRGQYSYGDVYAATSENIDFKWGVCHGDDLLYLFKSPAFVPELKNQTDLRMSEIFLTLWTNFATYGDPDPNRAINWNSLNINSLKGVQFLNITGSIDTNVIEMKIETGFYPERMRFWTHQNIIENFPIYHYVT